MPIHRIVRKVRLANGKVKEKRASASGVTRHPRFLVGTGVVPHGADSPGTAATDLADNAANLLLSEGSGASSGGA